MISSKGLLAASLVVLKGLVIPIAIGLIACAFKYPLGYADCHYYGQAKELPNKYVWFQCYIKDPKKGWMTQDEYQRASIGAKLIMVKE